MLPDIIITPSTDDMPSQVIMQHHIRVQPREPTKRTHSVEIEELVSKQKSRSICTNNHEVIDVLSQRLANINKIAGGNTQANLSKQLQKSYAGEQFKELGDRSPSENASNSDSDSDSEDDSSEDEEEDTPKMGARPAPLQAIKSVTNVQVYKGKTLEHNLDSESSGEEDDEEDVTTADEMFDEEEQIEEEQEGLVEEMDDDFMAEEDLSVIYEEESELERSSEYAKTVIRRDDSRSTLVDEIDKQIEENDNDDDEEDNESNSVTVRLPLRFSFSRSSNDENIATVQVGSTTQVEEKRPCVATQVEEKRPSVASSFSVAKVESEDEDDDCEVSVTISLSNSSRSNSVEKSAHLYRTSQAYPVEDISTPIKASEEDVSSSLSLSMRNKFAGETITNSVTNNICQVEPQSENISEVAAGSPKEEFDFFATLMATKMQAQKMMEQSKSFWKTPDPKPAEQPAEAPKLRPKENALEAKPPRPKSGDMSKTQASLEAAKNSFWSTFATTSKEPEAQVEPPVEVDFWASIEKKESQDIEEKQWTKKKKTVSYTPLQKETVNRVEHWTTTLRAQVESLPMPQRAEVHFVVEQKPKEIKQPQEEEEVDFWASVEEAKAQNTNKETSIVHASCKSEAEPEPETESEINIWAAQEEDDHVEEEVDFWSDIKSTTSSHEESKPNDFVYDPTKYPEEPREVDTDEEIDFWAEIEANRKPGEDDDDDVTFHKSATFWARKERQNSVEETPYKPVEVKAFRAKLPDEPAVEIDVWATLEAARGDEPEIVDPVVEEEKVLAEQFEELEHDTPEEIKEEEIKEEAQKELPPSNLSQMDTMSLASMHEPATVYTWANPTQETYEDEDNTDFWADIEEEREKRSNPRRPSRSGRTTARQWPSSTPP